MELPLTSSSGEPAKRPSLWPRAIISTFVLLAIGNGVILYLAISTKVAPMDEEPYEAGLRYEKTVSQKDAAKRDGIISKFEFVQDGLMALVTGLDSSRSWEAHLKLIRPNDSTLDQSAAIAGNDGRFEFKLRPLQTGLWLVKFEVISGDKIYAFDDRLIAP